MERQARDLEDAGAEPAPARVTERLRPAVRGLVAAAAGGEAEADGGRRFLGWSVGRHWLLDDATGARPPLR
ncbi:hypothetical protein [Streptomyces sp. NPDC002640]